MHRHDISHGVRPKQWSSANLQDVEQCARRRPMLRYTLGCCTAARSPRAQRFKSMVKADSTAELKTTSFLVRAQSQTARGGRRR
jgi:hypothetical protein